MSRFACVNNVEVGPYIKTSTIFYEDVCLLVEILKTFSIHFVLNDCL